VRVNSIDEVIRIVAEHVPYLDARRAATGDDWIGADALIADRQTLVEVVRQTKSGFGTNDDAVAASLFTEAYAFRAGGTALAAYALGLPVPDVAPAAVAVRIDKPRPSAVAYAGAVTSEPDAHALSVALIDEHFGPFVDAVHGQFRVGERNLWGNVAAACAVAFRAVESSVGDRPVVRKRAENFFAACAPTLAGLGKFTLVEHEGGEGWYWNRTSCCLWFRTAGGRLCDNCSLLNPAALAERRRADIH
jgi:ferric iron reductase protein FhuF